MYIHLRIGKTMPLGADFFFGPFWISLHNDLRHTQAKYVRLHMKKAPLSASYLPPPYAQLQLIYGIELYSF